MGKKKEEVKPLWECESLEEEVRSMQELINSGSAWGLEGAVGRRAMDLIKSGYCMLGEEGHRDYYGNYVPSRHEVKAGTPGSLEYCQKKEYDR